MMVRTDEELLKLAAASYSVSDMMRRMGLIPAGGNHTHYKKKLQQLGFKNFKIRPKKPTPTIKKRSIEDYLVIDGPRVNGSKLRKLLVESGLKQHRCEICGIENWLDKPISLHLDHIDGDRSNNKIKNLRILCPNCHSQTPTYGRIDSKRFGSPERLKPKCSQCGETCYIYGKNQICRRCFDKSRPTKINWPANLAEMVANSSKRQVAKMLGVSDKAVAKRLIKM